MVPPYFDLSGKVAIVSGGGTGIGRGIAEGIAEAGARIAIASRRREVCERACSEIADATGVETLPLPCDITLRDDIITMVAKAASYFGSVDILVNNSGVGGSEKPILQMEEEEDWDKVLNTNLKGVFLLSREVVKYMVEQGRGGKIINVASIGATVAWPKMSSYCASKGGCIQLTKVMALEWVRYNIQVNAISPGYFETPMNKEFFESEVGQKIIKAKIPMGRIGNIGEVKGAAVFLASDASSFMTGTTVVLDGGHTLE